MMKRKSVYDMGIFRERRERLAKDHQGAAFIIPSRPEFLRNESVTFPFRQDNNLFYLTGFEEAESLLVFRPGEKSEYVLFVREKDPTKELWTGFRFGPQGAVDEYGADEAFTYGEFEKRIVELLKPVDRVYFQLGGWHPEVERILLKSLDSIRTSRGRTGHSLLPVLDPNGPLGEMRVIKSDYEVQMLRRAARISAQAHREVMEHIRPGVNERYLTGVFLGCLLREGCQREGYGSILAGGANATCLHYVFNDQVVKDGDLFLIDAAGEYNYYTADITRTYPVNGKFTDIQGRFYEQILQAQKTLVEMVRPGVPYADIQATTIELLTDIMIDFKIVKTNRETAIKSLEFKKYYPHNVGHFLGMDVHDVGLYQIDGESRPLEPGMVITIEPGIYLPPDDPNVPEELRGVGIRIEDDVLVTPRGPDVLTRDVPKEIADLEAAIGKKS